MDRHITGRVQWYNPAFGTGFIMPDDGGAGVLVDCSVIAHSGIEELRKGDRVELLMQETPGGFPRATWLRLEGKANEDGPLAGTGTRLDEELRALLQTTIPVLIYTSGTTENGRAIRDAFLEIALECGITPASAERERGGSWWQRLRIKLRYAIESPEGQDALRSMQVALENVALNERQANIDSKRSESISKLIAATQLVDDVLIVSGASVFLKHDGRIRAMTVDSVTAARLAKCTNPQAAIVELQASGTISESLEQLAGPSGTKQIDDGSRGV